MTSSAGHIIYKAFAPTLKIWICIIIGFCLARRGMFPPTSARGVSTLSLNVGLPALIFSSIVAAFDPSNGPAFGSLIVMALMYLVVGLILSYAIRELVYVPADFQWGILVLGMFSNWGNMPIAVVQTLGQSAPFDGSSDVQLGVAYGSVFILVMNTLLFPAGLHKLCALDFKEENMARPPHPSLSERLSKLFESLKDRHARYRGEEEEKDSSSSERTVTEDADADRRGGTSPSEREYKDVFPSSPISGNRSDHGEIGEEPSELKQRAPHVRYTGGGAPIRKTSRASSFTSMMENTRPIPPTAPLDAVDLTVPCQPTLSRQRSGPDTGDVAPEPVNPLLPTCSVHNQPEYNYSTPLTPASSIHKKQFSKRFMSFLKGFITPITVAIAIAVPVSLILPLKALFVNVPGVSGHQIPFAPNGLPPLSFIMDTAVFLGGMSVPTSCILLGASFGRLTPPKSWRELPLAAVIGMTCVKMIIVPIFGIFVVQALRDSTNLFPKEDKMRTFVAILTSGTPAAINQLVVTQLFNPAGTAHTLAMFLSLQYAVMPILSTALAAIALYVVE